MRSSALKPLMKASLGGNRPPNRGCATRMTGLGSKAVSVNRLPVSALSAPMSAFARCRHAGARQNLFDL